MDALSDVLSKIKLSSAVYFKSSFSAPWGMEVPSGPFAQFHIVTDGECLLKNNNQVIELSAGDLIVFPKGANHWLADSIGTNRIAGQEVVQSILSGNSLFAGDQTSATLVCGHFEFDRSLVHSLIASLPDLIYIPQREVREKEWLENILKLVISETEQGGQGNEIVIQKLGEILFIHALRAYVELNDIAQGFLAALKDERISSSLKLLHSRPEENWTLESLARKVGMSRTSLATKFKGLVGETPMNYLTNWRMLNAKELLSHSKLTIREVAHAVGYQSETAFNRVFKDRVAQTPLKYRNSV